MSRKKSGDSMRRIPVSALIFLTTIGVFIAFDRPQPQPITPSTKTAAMATKPPHQASQTAAVSPVVVTLTPTPLPTIEPTILPTTAPQPTTDTLYYPTSGGIMGKVSYYSRAGCLGCSPNMITASGEPLDDKALTLAVVPGAFPMGQMVLVTNLSNGRQTMAKVNDTGGFAKYNRIADLSLALYTYLNAKTDDSIMLIEPVIK